MPERLALGQAGFQDSLSLGPSFRLLLRNVKIAATAPSAPAIAAAIPPRLAIVTARLGVLDTLDLGAFTGQAFGAAAEAEAGLDAALGVEGALGVADVFGLAAALGFAAAFAAVLAGAVAVGAFLAAAAGFGAAGFAAVLGLAIAFGFAALAGFPAVSAGLLTVFLGVVAIGCSPVPVANAPAYQIVSFT